jgi:NTE family protein
VTSGELRGPLFDGLDWAGRHELREQLRPVELAAGEVLCHAGDLSDSLYVVERGVLRVLDGARGAPLGRQRAGDVVGEVALLTREPRTATLVADMPTEVLELSRDAFLLAAARYPVLLANLDTIASRRLVSRTAKPLGRVTALLTAAGGWDGEAVATAVAVAASARELRVLDATGSLADVLAGIYAVARVPVLVRVPADCPYVAELVAYCDRQVVVGGGDDPERIGRRLARASVGLALGAGGAKGWAHVGVIRSLEQAGYAVDAVAGSSIGAWIGAWMALGHDAHGIDRLMREHLDAAAVETIFRRGGPDGVAELRRVALATVGDATFDDLDRPLSVVAADLAGRRTVVMTEGLVADALVAAMTVPGLHEPARRGDQRLVDAVVLAPVPTEAVTEADVRVAVNLLGGVVLPTWPGVLATTRVAPDRDPVVESLELASHAAAAAQTASAEVPLTPVFGPGTWRDFRIADRYLTAGEEAMAEALPALAALARPGRV